MKTIIRSKSQKGQALPEYAMLLVFISLVVVVGSALFGQSIGAAYSKVTDGLTGKVSVPVTGDTQPTAEPTQAPHPVLSVATAARKGNDHGNSLDVTLRTTGEMKISLADSQSHRTETLRCNGECHFTFPSVGKNSGTLIATTEFGDMVKIPYPEKD